MAGRSTRRFQLLGAAVLAVVVGWSVLWFIAATIVDRQVEKAEKMAMDAGATANCRNRSVTGFPFLIELRCREGSRAGNAEGIVTIGGLTVAAQVYNPTQLIAEMDGPVEVASAVARPMTADWDLAHASADLDLGVNAVRQLIGEVKALRLEIGGHEVVVGEVDATLRRNPEDAADLDVHVRIADLVPMPGAAPATVALIGRVAGGAPLLAGRPEDVLARLASAGLPLAIESITFRGEDLEIAAAGDLTLSPDGLVSGTLDVLIAGYDSGVPYLRVMDPKTGATVTQVLPMLLASAPDAKIGDRAAKKLSLNIVDSRLELGLFSLPLLPRIAVAEPH